MCESFRHLGSNLWHSWTLWSDIFLCWTVLSPFKKKGGDVGDVQWEEDTPYHCDHLGSGGWEKAGGLSRLPLLPMYAYLYVNTRTYDKRNICTHCCSWLKRAYAFSRFYFTGTYIPNKVSNNLCLTISSQRCKISNLQYIINNLNTQMSNNIDI